MSRLTTALMILALGCAPDEPCGDLTGIFDLEARIIVVDPHTGPVDCGYDYNINAAIGTDAFGREMPPERVVGEGVARSCSAAVFHVDPDGHGASWEILCDGRFGGIETHRGSFGSVRFDGGTVYVMEGVDEVTIADGSSAPCVQTSSLTWRRLP